MRNSLIECIYRKKRKTPPVESKVTGDVEAHLIALACHNPPEGYYEAFLPAEALRLSKRFEFHYTPKHGSWLDIAEIELAALTKQ